MLKFKNQRGFGHHLILFLIPLAFVIAIFAYVAMTHRGGDVPFFGSHGGNNTGVQEGSGPNYKALAKCGSDALFNTLPTTLTDYDQITPLGNINVPDHTQPTDHLYFDFKRVGNNAVESSVLAPGKIVVMNIQNTGETKNGTELTNDYAIAFTPCKGMSFLFGHVQSLSGKLAEAIAGNQWDKPCDVTNQAAGEQQHYCSKNTDILLNPGDLMGKVGGKPQLGAFDLNAYSASYKDPGYVDQDYNPNPHAVCALDYFTSETKTQLYAMIKRTVEPRCGVIGQDKANTAQGSWYGSKDGKQAQHEWNSHLSLVHDNLDPTIGTLGDGGNAAGQPSKTLFKPTHSGTINREPSEVTAGSVYCYQDEQALDKNNGNPSSGKYLLQLVDNKTLKVEHQNGSCTTSESFNSPLTYYR